jgi:transposase-like protein
MTHQKEATLPEDLMQLLCEPQAEHSRFANVLRLLLNEAMRLERATALQAQPYERTVERRGYANGYKPKTLATRLGPLELLVPQVRGDVDFYPSALERGLRSERALKLAIAEMYVQGVSTRKVTQVLERVHKELKRRTRVATLFPNEASLLRLVSAVLAELSEEWECGKVYLPHSGIE